MSDVVEQRFKLIEKWKEGEERVSGLAGLEDHPRAPHQQAGQIRDEVQERSLMLREEHPTDGSRVVMARAAVR